ncbi:ATP-binding protein [Pantoea brenneri]|uniref:ATP-binding protein n=1 Tax=Pantoea brenneri TaxID=472694 RepID=UPI00244D7012|nr:ATP-binding protein [Pantoea brenneri]MDH1085963.1 ATP-binding protein [Pantoea brenneri]
MSHVPTQRGANIQSLKTTISALQEELSFAGGKVSMLDRCFDRQETVAGICETHGNFQQQRIWTEYSGRVAEKFSRCPKCIAAELEAAQNKLRAIQTEMLTERANIPERFAACSFENYQAVNKSAQNNLSILRDYASAWPQMLDAGTSLILTGRPGTGKNHLAVALAKSIIEHHQATVLLTSVMRIIRAVRRTWEKGSERSEEEVIAHYTGVDLLIIDEIGIQYGSESEMIILFDIMNTRYERMLPTVLISNLSLPQISQVISDRLTDRMVEGGGATLVFDWPSYRSQKGAPAV